MTQPAHPLPASPFASHTLAVTPGLTIGPLERGCTPPLSPDPPEAIGENLLFRLFFDLWSRPALPGLALHPGEAEGTYESSRKVHSTRSNTRRTCGRQRIRFSAELQQPYQVCSSKHPRIPHQLGPAIDPVRRVHSAHHRDDVCSTPSLVDSGLGGPPAGAPPASESTQPATLAQSAYGVPALHWDSWTKVQMKNRVWSVWGSRITHAAHCARLTAPPAQGRPPPADSTPRSRHSHTSARTRGRTITQAIDRRRRMDELTNSQALCAEGREGGSPPAHSSTLFTTRSVASQESARTLGTPPTRNQRVPLDLADSHLRCDDAPTRGRF